MFFRIGVLKKFTDSTGKQFCRGLFLTYVCRAEDLKLLKRDSNAGVFL